MKKQEGKADGRTQIHNVRFYKTKPRSIQCMAHNKKNNKLALSRIDNSIEIWNMQFAPHLERVIESKPGGSIEGLAWSDKRLFSVDITGELVEWNWRAGVPRRTQLMTGNALWCIDVNPAGTELAVGTEEGYINIMNIEYDQLVYKTLFDKQAGRVLCCKYDATGDFLVTGSLNAVRIWNVHTGHALHCMTVKRAEKSNVIVWSIQVLRDFSIITGDSAGFITVWDGHTASQIEALKVLHSDILAVAVNEAEDTLMCTGIEPLIRILAKTQIKREEIQYNRWVKFLQRRVHNHAVKTLICVGDRMLSGGVDGYLTISSASRTRSDVAKYAPFPIGSCVSHAPAENLILLRYINYLELWRLGNVKEDSKLNNKQENGFGVRKHLPLENMPEKLLVIKSVKSDTLVSAAISPDGQWICYSTQNDIRYFSFTPATAKSKAELVRITDLPEQFGPASHIHFTSDSNRLLLLKAKTKQLLIFALLNDSSLGLMETLELGKYIKDKVSHMLISQSGKYIVIAGIDRTIAVWSLSNGKHYQHHLNLPHYSAPTTALALHDNQPRLVASFADGKVYEYDLEEMCFTCASSVQHVKSTATHCTYNIVLDAKNPDIFIMQNDTNLFVLEKMALTNNNEAVSDEQEEGEIPEYNLRSTPKKKVANKTKSPTKGSPILENKVSKLRLKLELNYEHLLHLCRQSPNELIAVGVDPATLIEQLPHAYRQKKFGVS